MFKFEVNDKNVVKQLEQIGGFSDEMAEEIANNLAVVAHNTARNLVPVDTGALKQSITLEVVKEDGGYAAYIGSDLEYAPDVEYGKSNQRAQPYLQPAGREAEQQMPKIAQAVVDKYVK